MLGMDIFEFLLETAPKLCNFIMEFNKVEQKCNKLEMKLYDLEEEVVDMNLQLRAVDTNPYKRQKDYVVTFFELKKRFQDKAGETLKNCEKGRKWNLFSMLLTLRQLDYLLMCSEDLLSKADQLKEEGLTYDMFTRGIRLYANQLIGNTANQLRTNLLESLKKDRVIGIHGNHGSGKTNFMKTLHNVLYDDTENFKAVLWVSMPEKLPLDVRGIQEYVAKALHFNLDDEDTVRRSSLLAKKFMDMAPGHVVVFLDNVKEPFQPCEVGIPISGFGSENFNCTVVFTATSEDICNKMSCSNFTLDLLPEDEARELLLHEADLKNYYIQSCDERMTGAVDDVAKECSRMPLVITQIGRSLIGKEEIFEWNTRRNELMGILSDPYDNEAKILDKLKFCFDCIKDRTVWACFLDSTKILFEKVPVTRQDLVEHWIQGKKIGQKRRRGASRAAIYDQGHTIINELKRLYLLEIVERDGTEYVMMNKWVGRLAAKISLEGEDAPR
ncbi:disease resistance protein UNI-like [Amaranthus tricolor]|uniref:disease resistance protein UNI-like n=1 Tax=Amaranthus tricolor TaxID=29722 RepID=UPI00258DF723|nr:disease resistance protein UNI-like [Amaranthus tricolor]XP_057548720.1 disease resistance protein UNI-like [Amaranthus tricolor]XP_057548721.1 disease resistance protein UNI-like [Amaranthus tricolor]XP_057548722.1 disease resistance protein UNI-like [Amaranthus tricolor]